MAVKTELKHIIVFEHQRLLVNQGEQYLSESQYQALVSYYGNYSPFYSLIRNGVQFCQYVGALQIGDTLIEILPKADNSNDKVMWQNLLVNMIRSIRNFPVRESGTSNLKLKNNSVLDLYFELYVTELETLLHLGLVKKYIREEKNSTSLKGKLSFSKHIQKNLVHRERFYIETTTYSLDHTLNQILYTALQLLSRLNRNNLIASRIGNLLLSFPEQCAIKINNNTFSRIVYDRKTVVYQQAMEIAELLLLNYHPDLSKGSKNVLALMFDMNVLWENFVLSVLKRKLISHRVSGQVSKKFWTSTNMNSSMRPDIVIVHRETKEVVVLDTKWKNLNGYSPSPDDLRQMYVYHEYFEASKVALIYPGESSNISGQFYLKDQTALDNKFCHILQVPINKDFTRWKVGIVNAIYELIV